MTKQLLKRWVAALRSGKYKQGKARMKWANQYGTHYCCLGVLHEVAREQGITVNTPINCTFFLTPDLEKLGIADQHQSELAAMNDAGVNFKAIASHIEKEIGHD